MIVYDFACLLPLAACKLSLWWVVEEAVFKIPLVWLAVSDSHAETVELVFMPPADVVVLDLIINFKQSAETGEEVPPKLSFEDASWFLVLDYYLSTYTMELIMLV